MQQNIVDLLRKIEALEASCLAAEEKYASRLQQVHPVHQLSARNLLHYLAVRSHDLRSLQNSLSSLAISSHGHSEAYTLNNLQKIKRLLRALLGRNERNDTLFPLDNEQCNELLNEKTAEMFGPAAYLGQTKLMVTLPTEAATDYNMILGWVKDGMDVARINTAHDDIAVWEQMMSHCRNAAQETGNLVKIYIDLAGPKMRTDSMRTVLHDAPKDKKKKQPHILVQKGDMLRIVREKIKKQEGDPAISITMQEIFDFVEVGHTIWFDDGKIGGIVRYADADTMMVEIIQAKEGGSKLKAEKGVNLPDTDLRLPSLTEEDINNLPFIASHADMIGYSFVQHKEDVALLQEELAKLQKEDVGIVLKIETRRAFENLPELLLQVMQSRHAAIMVARGDLAVELGFQRMAEVQEEILWLAEAAHLPVIWATQVLETQVKKGTATRAEISDVVLSSRAECVMLNKGPNVPEALKMLRDIDKRMAAHEEKKRKVLRSLNVAKNFLDK